MTQTNLSFKRWLTPPTFADEEQSRLAGLQHTILWGTIAIALIFGLLTLVFQPEPWPRLLITARIGYELEAPMSTFYRLPELGSEVELRTHLVVREDAHLLYGFATEDERRLFRDLLSVTGIGPKIGLALLSGIDVETFMRCVEAEDAAALTRIPGIGRQTAERLLVEMRDRIRALGQLPSATPRLDQPAGAQAEAFAALVALGYRPAEVTRLLKSVDNECAGTEELIRRALQAAAR